MANFDTIEARRQYCVDGGWRYDILPDPAVLSSSTETVNHREALVGAFYRYTDTALSDTRRLLQNATVDAPLFLHFIALEYASILLTRTPWYKHLHTQYAMSF